MRYANARYEQYRQELAYRIYLTDSVNSMAQGKYIKARFVDLLYQKPADTRPAMDIAHDILSKAGIEVISNGSI